VGDNRGGDQHAVRRAEGPRGDPLSTEDLIVSTDIVGDPHSSVFDSEQTMVIDGRMVKVIAGTTTRLLKSPRRAQRPRCCSRWGGRRLSGRAEHAAPARDLYEGERARRRAEGKIALLRVDFNAARGRESRTIPIRAALPTIELRERGAAVLVSHLDCPDGPDPKLMRRSVSGSPTAQSRCARRLLSASRPSMPPILALAI
jgi:hypothetical protein